MSFQAALTIAILLVTLVVLASQRLRPDITAVCATLALILTNVLTPEEAFGAFGQPVIIIIPSVYVLGAALYETGVATMLANWLSRLSQRGPRVLTLAIMLAAGLLSSVLSSLLVIVILMPAVLRISRRDRIAPAQLLLPLAMAASVGNLLTLIGTISNLVVSDLLAQSGAAPLGFLSLAPVGLLSLLLAIAWFLLVGHRFLSREMPDEPSLPSLEQVEDDYRLGEQLYRLRVRSISDLVGQRVGETRLSTEFGLNVLAVEPREGRPRAADAERPLEKDDVLVVEGTPGNALQAANLHGLESKGSIGLDEFNQFEYERLALAELMVPFRSELVNKTLAEVRFRERYGLNVLAIRRHGRAIREDLQKRRMLSGDTLLVQGPAERLQKLGRDYSLVLVTQLGPQPGDLITGQAKVTIVILVAMIAAVVTGLLSLATASATAAIVLILTGCISVQRAYRSVEGHVIVLVGAMLPLAMALEKTGAAATIAGYLANLSPAIGALGTLALLYLFAAVVTQVVSNSATAALVTPLAISLAATQGLPPQPFVMAMAIAVTASYLTPLTNTDNLLVREAGGYRLGDHVLHGLPLVLLQAVVALALAWLAGVR